MSSARIILVVAVLAAIELGVFRWRYTDLVYLDQSVAVLAQEPADRFTPNVDRALMRESLTRDKLETIAQAAAARSDRDLALRALKRLANEYPADAGVHMRLAEALRAAGRMDEAAAAYRHALATTAGSKK
jgi:Flp pilus assembly protein TadD